MNNVQKIITTAAISAIAMGYLILPNSVYAEIENKTKSGIKNCEIHQEVLKAFENLDFEKWKSAMNQIINTTGKVPLVYKVVDTQEEFEKLALSKDLLKQGKYEEARKIRFELGLIGELRKEYRKHFFSK